MNAQQTKQTIQTEARRLGFELVYSNLLTGCFHLKQGSTVRMGFVWRRIDPSGIASQVKSVSQYGERLDTKRDSVYFIN
jgi:hypothetical protein